MKTKTSILRLVLVGLSALCFTGGVAFALDLTPRQGLRQGNEGPPTPVLRFSEGQNAIEFRPPPGWQASGGGHALTFYTSEPTSWMKLTVVNRGNPGAQRKPRAQGNADTQGGADAETEDLQEWAKQFAPVGAEKVAFIKMIPSPFTAGPHASTEYQYGCVLNGFRMELSISVVDYSDKERLVMLVAAEPGNFEPMRQLAITSMFSWAEVK